MPKVRIFLRILRMIRLNRILANDYSNLYLKRLNFSEVRLSDQVKTWKYLITLLKLNGSKYKKTWIYEN